MNEFTPTSLPVRFANWVGTGGVYQCPYVRCWAEHKSCVRFGDLRCKRCGVVLEWLEDRP